MKRFLILFLISSFLFTLVCAAADIDVTESSDAETELTEDTADTDITETGSEEETETEIQQPDELSASVSVKGDYFISGEDITVFLNVNGASLRGGIVKLSYDTDIIFPVSVTHTETEGVTVYHSVSDGRITFIFYTDESYTADIRISDIAFKVKDGKAHDMISVKIEEATVSDGVNEVPASAQSHTFMLLYDIHTDITETEIHTVTETQTQTETQTEEVTETETETETETQIQTETQTEEETETETETETEKQTQTETQTEEVTETETETDSQTADNKKQPKSVSGMPVITAVIAAAAAGAAVGAVFIIRNAVKKLRVKS